MNEIRDSFCYRNIPIYIVRLQGDRIDYKELDKVTIKVGKSCFVIPGQLSYSELYTQRYIDVYETIPVVENDFERYLKRKLTKEPYILAACFQDLKQDKKEAIENIEPLAPSQLMGRPFYQLVSIEQQLMKEEPSGLKFKVKNIVDHFLDAVLGNEKEEKKRR